MDRARSASTRQQRPGGQASTIRQTKTSGVDVSKYISPQERLDAVLRGEIGYSDLGNSTTDQRIIKVFESGRYGNPDKYRNANPEIMERYNKNKAEADMRQKYAKAYAEETEELRKHYTENLSKVNNTIESEKLYAMNVLGLDAKDADVYAYMRFHTKLSDREIQDYLRDGNPATTGFNGFINSINKGIGTITDIAQMAFNPVKAIEEGLSSEVKSQGTKILKQELIGDFAKLLGDGGMTKELFRIDNLRDRGGIPVYDEQLYGVQTDALDQAYRQNLDEISARIKQEQGLIE